MFSDLGNVKGFLQNYKHNYFIHVNCSIENDNTIEKINAHELGHYFLHKSLNTFQLTLNTLAFESKLEYEANLFASELLLPDNILIEELLYIEGMNSYELASYFNLDIEILRLKMKSNSKNYLFFTP